MTALLVRLPPHKQEELRLITSIIRAMAPVEMIILFGGHASGDWNENIYLYQEGQVIFEYESDFDILVVTKDKITCNNTLLWDRIENRISRLGYASAILNPYSIND